MTAEDRQDALLLLISKEGNKHLDDISKEFGVSSRTIRRDCEKTPLIIIDKIIQYPDKKSMSRDKEKNVKTQILRGSQVRAAESVRPVKNRTLGGSSEDPSHTSHLSPPYDKEFGRSPVSKMPTIPPYIHEIVDIQDMFKSRGLKCTVKDAMELREQAVNLGMLEDRPPFDMPPKVANCKKQVDIINAIVEPGLKLIIVEGDKRTGKSTVGFMGCNVGVYDGIFKRIGLWAAGDENAVGILENMYTDDLTAQWHMPLFKGFGSRHRKTYFNNSYIDAHSNKAASTSGLDFDFAWIDEAHEVMVQQPDIFAMIIMTMRAKPDCKLLLTMNKGEGGYEYFMNTTLKELAEEGIAYKFFTLEKSDITHIDDETDAFVRIMVKAAKGEEYAERWLDNIAPLSGRAFNPASIEMAYNTYDQFMLNPPLPAYVIASYDPSGTGHRKGFTIFACDAHGANFWELHSGSYQLGKSHDAIRKGIGMSAQHIRNDIALKCRTFGVQMFISESNMDGPEMVLFMQQQGFRAIHQNFSGEEGNRGASRGRMIAIMREIMDVNAIFMKGKELSADLFRYNPEKESSEKYKGDVADAAIHNIFRLCVESHSQFMYKSTISVTGVA
jgi:hypothetical protein